jgi:hypothetical protein
MALELVDQPEGGKITVNGAKATVTIEGTTSREVCDTNAKQVVLNAAPAFLNKPGISGQCGPYPVNADGSQLRVPDTENCSGIE